MNNWSNWYCERKAHCLSFIRQILVKSIEFAAAITRVGNTFQFVQRCVSLSMRAMWKLPLANSIDEGIRHSMQILIIFFCSFATHRHRDISRHLLKWLRLLSPALPIDYCKLVIRQKRFFFLCWAYQLSESGQFQRSEKQFDCSFRIILVWIPNRK